MEKKRIAELKEQVIQFGKEVAESHSTTQFPKWVHFKIGISILQGYPYEKEYWENRITPGIDADSN